MDMVNMDSLRIAAISFGNYAIGLSHIHELLQIIVASLSIIYLIINIKGKK